MSETGKPIKVTLEYEDVIKVLEGKEAERWIEWVNSYITLETHRSGKLFPLFNWKEKRK